MKESCFVFIESNTSGTGKIFIDKAKELCFKVIFFCSDPGKYLFLKSTEVELHICDTTSFELTVNEINKLKRIFEICGVWSSSDRFVELASRIALNFSLPGPDPVAISSCRDKLMQKKLCKKLKIKTPQSEILTREVWLTKKIDFPVILKPRTGTGSSGVFLAYSKDEIKKYAGEEFLIEEFIKGQEYSIEIFDAEVICVVKKHTSELPYFIETGHDIGFDLDPKIIKAFKIWGRKVALDFNLAWGPIHIECKLIDDEPTLIEINPRLAGGYIPVAIQKAGWDDLILLTIMKCSGINYEEIKSGTNSAIIRFIIPDKEGNLRISYPDLIDGEVIFYDNHSHYAKHNDFRDRVGHVLMWGSKFKELENKMNKTIQNIFFEHEDH
ncbi:ATP-grasp domain-containing protein (plasmid) [Pantoea agglomerans]|uniref:ATP-grasp domain-containing protein n=1 Tax=Enterobacter agglomerans TaxID=549 RepID=UPI00273A67D5|nr:ATP-grasp domain-containing protein [Pantoea agglomerans]WLO87194.1 ATP-grasp domain-containing protein [Pantoea agglomerans]